MCASVPQPFPETGPGISPRPGPTPRGHEPDHMRSHLAACWVWLCVSSKKRFQVSGGRCRGWGAGELGTRQSPPPRGGLCHGVSVFGPRCSDHWTDVRCWATGSAQPAGPALLESVPGDSWARPGGPGGPTTPGFLQLPRVPRCGCAKALGPRLPPGGDQAGGPTGQRQPGSPSAWPQVAGSSPADPHVPLPFPSPRQGRRTAGC